jgi:hypothetical protein
MSADSASINMISLTEFNTRLTARLGEAQSVLFSLQADPVLTGTGGLVKPPKLGTFEDALTAQHSYATLYEQYVQRLQQLHDAITAAQKATTTIVANYHSTESLNEASAKEITSALAGVPSVLGDAS